MSTNGTEILNGTDLHDDQAFNWKLFLTIGWINRWWLVVYFIIVIVTAYLLGRYTTPIYESQTNVQFNDRSKDNTVDLGILVSKPNVDRLNEEMTILNSKGYKVEALRSLPLKVSYFIRERVKAGEIYTNSPFTVDIVIIDSAIIGNKIEFDYVDKNSYQISYDFKDEHSTYTFEFDKSYNTAAFNINAHSVPENSRPVNQDLYFVINDEKQEAEKIATLINIDVDNLYGGKININYRDKNRFKAQDVVNTVATEIVVMSLVRKANSAEMIISFIKDQIDSLERQLYNQENILKNFKKENLIISPELAETNVVTKLNEVDRSKFEVMMEQKSLIYLKEFTNNNNEDIDALNNYFGDLKFNDFSPYFNSLLDLKKQKEDLGLSVPPTDPRMVSINKQIETVKKNFKDAIVNAENKLAVRKQYLDEEQRKYEAQFLQLPEKQSEFARLTRLNDLKEKYYLLLLEKQSEYEITRAGMSSDYVVLDPAESGSLVAPVKTKIWGICLLIGVGLSFAHVYIRFLLHSTIIGVPDVEKLTDVPLLGVLPLFNKINSELPQVVVNKNPKSHIAEAFRTIRSNMQYFLRSKANHHVIAITSTVSSEGKTFTALNLASVISSAGKKVILMDFDLRKPKVHKAFNLKNDKGVSSILIKKHSFEECIVHLEEYGFDILIAGPVPPNPAELLISPASDELLDYVRAKYDLVIIDSPPVGIVSDTIPILSKVDLAIYIIRANFSKRTFIENVNRLYYHNQLKNITIIVNDADASGTSYGYGYGYGYSYGYSGYNDYYEESAPKKNLLRRFLNLKFWMVL